jgi:hypothetical protein
MNTSKEMITWYKSQINSCLDLSEIARINKEYVTQNYFEKEASNYQKLVNEIEKGSK